MIATDVIEVGPGDLRLGGAEATLTCRGLGSCVGLALWDPSAEVGGLAHVVLPDSGRYRRPDRPGMFADLAPRALVEAMKALGARPSRIVAKVAGGATIFVATARVESPIFDVGRRNVAALVSVLGRTRIPIVAEDTGGGAGRSIEFRVRDGLVRVRTTGGLEKEL